ncbi:MAG: hypothetical protein ACT4QC_17675 [Planctomycetaceae bacterium]
MSHQIHAWRCTFALIVVGSGLGCTDDPYLNIVAVTGTVTCGGEPAAGGTVTFTPLDAASQTRRTPGEPGRTSSAMVKEDGTFVLRVNKLGSDRERPGALMGPHTVTFKEPLTKRKVVSGMQLRLPPEAQKELQAEFDATPVFPPLACGNTISPTKVEVKGGAENHFEFTLSGSPIEPPADAGKPVAPKRRGGPVVPGSVLPQDLTPSKKR